MYDFVPAVVNVDKCGDIYTVKDKAEAVTVCDRHGGTVATMAQLQEAFKNGLSVCACGWLADTVGQAAYGVYDSTSFTTHFLSMMKILNKESF